MLRRSEDHAQHVSDAEIADVMRDFDEFLAKFPLPIDDNELNLPTSPNIVALDQHHSSSTIDPSGSVISSTQSTSQNGSMSNNYFHFKSKNSNELLIEKIKSTIHLCSSRVTLAAHLKCSSAKIQKCLQKHGVDFLELKLNTSFEEIKHLIETRNVNSRLLCQQLGIAPNVLYAYLLNRGTNYAEIRFQHFKVNDMFTIMRKKMIRDNAEFLRYFESSLSILEALFQKWFNCHPLSLRQLLTKMSDEEFRLFCAKDNGTLQQHPVYVDEFIKKRLPKNTEALVSPKQKSVDEAPCHETMSIGKKSKREDICGAALIEVAPRTKKSNKWNKNITTMFLYNSPTVTQPIRAPELGQTNTQEHIFHDFTVIGYKS